jgi:GAF domain-containing protein
MSSKKASAATKHRKAAAAKKPAKPASPAKPRSVRPAPKPADSNPYAVEWQKVEAVQSVFRKSAQLAEDLLHETERLRSNLQRLERDNAAMRTQLASDQAMRDLLKKIKQLETEKSTLLSHMHEAEAASTRYSSRYSEMEEELAKLANVYIASYQLHSTLRLPRVVTHLKELLQQLVGARSYGIYWSDATRKNLVLFASENLDVKKHAKLALGGDDAVDPVVERAFLTGVPAIAEGKLDVFGEGQPAAVVPMHFDERVVGLIVVYSVFEQKSHFTSVDFELFKMLGAHAASALTGALLFAAPGAKLPGPEAFRHLGS